MNKYLEHIVDEFILYKESKKYEEYAYVLDYLPHSRPGMPRASHSTIGILQLIGESYFTLLEASPQKDAEYNICDKIYVGKGERAKVERILSRITYDELTSAAKAELPAVIEQIIIDNEERFIEFLNTSPSLTPRMHSLELLPGIGKKLMYQIIDLRERLPFENFEEFKNRVNLSDPVKLITRRILKELSEDEKYNIFTRPF
jgi:putative nucleotide binding protein